MNTNLLNIRSWADARAFLHVALPAISVVLVTAGYLTSQVAALWVALAVVVVDSAVLSTFNTANGFRKALYLLLPAAGAVLVYYGYTTDETWALWTGLAPVLFGGGVAAANTDTTPATS